MTTKNCANGPKLVLKDLCEKSFVRNVRLPTRLMRIPPKPPDVIKITIKYKCRHKINKPSLEGKIYPLK